MDRYRRAFKSIISWTLSNYAFLLYSLIISALIEPVREYLTYQLSLNSISVFLILALAVYGVLDILARVIRWLRDRFSHTPTEHATLKLITIPDCPASGYGWLRFRLDNLSSADVRECYAELAATTKEDDPNYKVDPPQMLKWSSENPPLDGRKDISAGNHFKIDIAAPNNREGFNFRTQNGMYSGNQGNYSASILIHGVYLATPFTRQFCLNFSFETATNFSCDQNEEKIELR